MKKETGKLRVHPAAQVIFFGNRLQIRSIADSFTIEDRDNAIRRLLQLCDGTADRQAILKDIAPILPQAAEVIDFLTTRGLITADPPDYRDLFLYQLDLKAESYRSAVDENAGHFPLKIAVSGTGVFAETIRTTCDVLPTELIHSENAADVVVFASDRLDHTKFRGVNRQAVSEGKVILFAAIDQALIRVGPLVIPGECACFECHHHRIRSQLRFRSEFDARVSGDAALDSASPRLAAQAGAVLVAAVIVGYGFRNPVWGRPNQIIEQDLLQAKLEVLPLLKLPRCPVCGPGGPDRLQAALYEPAAVP